MPVKNILLAVMFGLLLAVGITRFMSDNNSNQVFSHKSYFEKNLQRTIASKANAMLDITIEATSGIPENDDQDVTLKASITLKRPIDTDLEYKWALPEEVKLVSGHLEDGWNNVQVGQTVSTEITVQGLSKESPGRSVILYANSTSNNYKIGYSGVFTIETPEVETEVVSNQQKKTVQSKKEIFDERLKGITF